MDTSICVQMDKRVPIYLSLIHLRVLSIYLHVDLLR